jgi:hypothetical protein
MARIGSRSTPIMRLDAGIVLDATCSQPPGAAHRSSKTPHLERKSYFLLSWISLKAARERYPCSLARW